MPPQTEISQDNAFLIEYEPWKWSHYKRFLTFHSNTFQFRRDASAALRGVGGHLNKASILFRAADRLVSEMEKEREAADRKGFSAGHVSREYAALVEGVITELYSAIDCCRKVLGAIYGKYRGITSDSTRKLFRNASDKKIDDRVPADIRNILANAEWYDNLRVHRDAIVHGEVGFCHLDSNSGIVNYFHVGMGNDKRCHVVQDIRREVEVWSKFVRDFIDAVFRCLNREIADTPTVHICGTFRGRIYTRMASPSESHDFSSGTCQAHEWFDKEENPTCPMKARCIAYSKATNTKLPDNPFLMLKTESEPI